MNNETTNADKVTKLHMDDHEKHIEANIKMEKKLKLDPSKEVIASWNKFLEEQSRVVMHARRPQLPKKLIILSVEWDILYFDKQIEVDEDREERLFGQVLYDNNTIRVFRGKRKKECIFETLFHEWLHIVMVQMDYRYAFNDTDKEEKFVHAISNAFNDLFWRNFR